MRVPPSQVFFSIYIFNSSSSSVLTAQCFSIPLFCVSCVSTNFQVSTVIKLSTHHKWECLTQGCSWSVLNVSEHQCSCSSAPHCYPKRCSAIQDKEQKISRTVFLENETHTLLLTEGNMFHLSRKLDEIQSLTLSGSERQRSHCPAPLVIDTEMETSISYRNPSGRQRQKLEHLPARRSATAVVI